MKDAQHNGVGIIRKFAKEAPKSAGVYRMLNAQHEILYIGKAKNLSKRIQHYTNIATLPLRLQRMVMAVAKVEVTTTATEAEALLLEANLIKQHKPRFNIELKDDKSFPYIAIDDRHDYPRIFKHRGERKKGVDYFGPFAGAGDVNRSIAQLQRSFLIRPCTDSVFSGRSRPCLEYQIKRCSAPCTNKISRDDYATLVTQAKKCLLGKSREVQEELQRTMLEASEAQAYERAAQFRDRIKALTSLQNKQYINVASISDADVIGIYAQSGIVCIQVFFFRAGHAQGNRAYFPKHTQDYNESDILEAFMGRFYQNNPAPTEIIVSHPLPSVDILKEALHSLYARKIIITTPKKGEKKQLIKRACDNAKKALEYKIKEDVSQRKLLSAIATLFNLDETPKRIEVFDNSHISGAHAIGAMIVADSEGFLKNSYRKFNMHTSPGDDYAMMQEMLTRRYAKLKKESEDSSCIWPDLVIIDGGPGHCSIVHSLFEDLGLGELPYVCIAKGPERNAGRETFYQFGKKPFQLPENDPVLFYLQRLRDEAHRFAIISHRNKRSRALKTSRLDALEGVGPKRKKALLHYFGSTSAVEAASEEDIAKVEGINQTLAKHIYDQLHSH